MFNVQHFCSLDARCSQKTTHFALIFHLQLSIIHFQFSILDVHAADEVAGDDVDGGGFRVGGMCDVITDATYEAAALHYDVDVGGYKELDAAAEGVDVDFFVLSNDGLTQVHADAAAEGIETGTVEGLAAIDVLVAAVVNRAADAFAVFTNGQRALEPLVGVTAVAVDNQIHTHVEHHEDAEISCPGLLGYLCKPIPMDNAPDGRQLQQTGYDENNSDNRSWFHNFLDLKLAAKVRRNVNPSKFLG